MKPAKKTVSAYQLGWVLLGLLISLLILEGWRYAVKPTEVSDEQAIQETLSEASAKFLNQQKKLLSQTEELASLLRPALLQNRSANYIHELIRRFPDFWQATLYREGQPFVWEGYALRNGSSEQINNNSQSTLKKHNNVIFWEAHHPFRVKTDTQRVSYELYTSFRIEQRNPLPIGDQREYNLFQTSNRDQEQPISFNIFNTPPKDITHYQPLLNMEGDSVGVVYATSGDFQQNSHEWKETSWFWRSIYILISLAIILSILFFAVDQYKPSVSLSIQLLLLFLAWLFFSSTDLPSYWILYLSETNSNDWNQTVAGLKLLITNSFFALCAAITLVRKVRYWQLRIGSNWYLSSFGLTTIAGIICAGSILFVLNGSYNVLVKSSSSLIDLQIFPGWDTILLYLSLGMSLLALGIVLMAILRFLFASTYEHFKLTISVLLTSFVISLFIAQLVFPDYLSLNWVFYTSILFFGIILILVVGYKRDWALISTISPLRRLVIGSLSLSIVGLPIIYQASLEHIDEKLWERAQSYAQEEDPLAADLTKNLLIELEQNFRGTSKEALASDRSRLQARFSETIEDFIQPEWNTYSFDLHLVSQSGDLIADYATDLNSPNWLEFFNISTLRGVTEIEQINRFRVRPVVQLPQLINQHNYRTFYRGWIPIFNASDENPVAWVLCSIYKERPQFNKPIRAVMASLTYEDWNTAYLMQKFDGNNFVNSVQQGFAGYFPQRQTLEPYKLEALEEDSLLYLTEEIDQDLYRTLLWNTTNDNIINVTTALPGYRVILFAFLRLSFTLLLAGSLFVLVAYVISRGKMKLFGRNKHFRNRILDSFLLATLVFLILLIATTYYAIKKQNQDIVQHELFDKLERLSEVMETNTNISNEQTSATDFSLDFVTASLNVDATLYFGRRVSETTTPQIYQQHILPSALPYNVFNELFVKGQQVSYNTVSLSGQPLLIGYRSIRDAQSRPVATVAIPTFLESPKYDQQLLETTSYLILIYLLVFSLFTLGASFISKQLTRPLLFIQRGLNKISSGNLNTTIPITSEDEIGDIAQSYNHMVDRLKNLQQELAAAEREAAWKEMAQQVAHEIKNPLTPMKLNVQHLERRLQSDTQNPEELKKSVQKITANLIEQIQSLSNIASDFSKFSQPLDKDFEKININDLLSSVSDLYQHDNRVEIRLKTPKEPIVVNGLADELKRVIINLVKNAYEAMPESGGIIIMRAYQNKHVFIEIEDNGQGIREEDRPNIFVPNFSTKSSGTGLGLAICKKIVEAHEGSISFASVKDEGTTFVIKLPKS